MKKVPASTVAEVVIALTIIAVCFAVAAQVFTQTNRSTIQFMEVREQTEFQSLMLDALVRDTLPPARSWRGELTTIADEMTKADSSVMHRFVLSNDERTIWEQEIFYEK